MRKLNLQDEWQAKALLTLQRRSYEVEAELIGFRGIPPLHESLANLQGSGETFYGAFIGEELVGAISFQRENTVVTICRLVVDPNHFRQGIGGRLLRFLLDLVQDCSTIRVSTGSLNTPARNLYGRHGFQEHGTTEVASGVFVTHFERPMSQRSATANLLP